MYPHPPPIWFDPEVIYKYFSTMLGGGEEVENGANPFCTGKKEHFLVGADLVDGGGGERTQRREPT